MQMLGAPAPELSNLRQSQEIHDEKMNFLEEIEKQKIAMMADIAQLKEQLNHNEELQVRCDYHIIGRNCAAARRGKFRKRRESQVRNATSGG